MSTERLVCRARVRGTWLLLLLGMFLGRQTALAQEQSGGLDDRLVALTYHKVARQPLDLAEAAAHGEAAQRARRSTGPTSSEPRPRCLVSRSRRPMRHTNSS